MRWFLATSLAVWLAMVVILVVLPDALSRWLSIEFARGVGWAVACLVWVVSVERQWQARFGPLMRFVLQLILWVAAAALAVWASETLTPRY